MLTHCLPTGKGDFVESFFKHKKKSIISIFFFQSKENSFVDVSAHGSTVAGCFCSTDTSTTLPEECSSTPFPWWFCGCCFFGSFTVNPPLLPLLLLLVAVEATDKVGADAFGEAVEDSAGDAPFLRIDAVDRRSTDMLTGPGRWTGSMFHTFAAYSATARSELNFAMRAVLQMLMCAQRRLLRKALSAHSCALR